MQLSIEILASEFGVSKTLQELEQDIDAQLECLYDPDHPKRAVFLCRDQKLGDRKIPAGIFVERRPEGTLVTDSNILAMNFAIPARLTDDMLAAILGYPETKTHVLKAGVASVVQARNNNGFVVYEAITSKYGLDATIEAAKQQMPPGGVVTIVSVQDALARRLKRMN